MSLRVHEFDLNEPVGETYLYAWLRADSFILTQRQKGTRKWPIINRSVSGSREKDIQK